MKEPFYIEDIFLKFFDTMSTNRIFMQPNDRSAAVSFYTSLNSNAQLTENQAKYILRILTKYRNTCQPYYDFIVHLEQPLWKNSFRIIDQSKKVWVEQDGKEIWMCFRFPFQLKEEFDREIISQQGWASQSSQWDRERKIRKLKFYDYNSMPVFDFCKERDFEIDESFMEALSNVEEIWQNQKFHQRGSVIENNQVFLRNAPEDALDYFNSHKSNKVSADLILAKNMGYIYNEKPNNVFEKIASNKGNRFFARDIEQFLQLSYGVEGKILLILERSERAEDWIRHLAFEIEKLGYDRTDFRVCFRSSNKENPDFNKWVNQSGFGGKIQDAKFLIFQQKPAKWLFKDVNDVIIVATNELLPGMNSTARAMFNNHPCVVFIGEYKPVKDKEDIVEL